MARVGITLSKSDPAGETMLGILREIGFEDTNTPDIMCKGDIFLLVTNPLVVPAEEYRTPAQPNPYPIDYDGIAQKINLDYIIVASRHWARSGQPSLTVHATGNFGKAVYGGRTRELQRVPPNPMRNVYKELLVDPPRGFQVSLEATHHSPTQFDTPMFFAEVGSSERQWVDKDVCRYLIEAILRGTASQSEAPIGIGFGGGHYCPKFSIMEKEIAFGHIAAKYALIELTEDTIGQMISKTSGNISRAYIEDSVKGFERKKVEVALDKLNLESQVI